MWTAIVSAIEFLLGFIFKKKVDPSEAQLADSNARAQDEARNSEATNVVVTEAAQARAADDNRRVLDNTTSNEVVVDPNAAVNRDPNAHFRD